MGRRGGGGGGGGATERVCVECNVERQRSDFSKNQWEKGDGGRCKTCVEASAPAPAAKPQGGAQKQQQKQQQQAPKGGAAKATKAPEKEEEALSAERRDEYEVKISEIANGIISSKRLEPTEEELVRATKYAQSSVEDALKMAKETGKDCWEDEMHGDEPAPARSMELWSASERDAAVARARAAADAVLVEAVKLSREPGAFSG